MRAAAPQRIATHTQVRASATNAVPTRCGPAVSSSYFDSDDHVGARSWGDSFLTQAERERIERRDVVCGLSPPSPAEEPNRFFLELELLARRLETASDAAAPDAPND